MRWHLRICDQVLCGHWLEPFFMPSTLWWSGDEWTERTSWTFPCFLVSLPTSTKTSFKQRFECNENIVLMRCLIRSGFVGLFNLLLLWPGFLLLHYTGFEAFELPSQLVWTYIIINGLIGTVLSEFLWLWWDQSSVSQRCEMTRVSVTAWPAKSSDVDVSGSTGAVSSRRLWLARSPWAWLSHSPSWRTSVCRRWVFSQLVFNSLCFSSSQETK